MDPHAEVLSVAWKKQNGVISKSICAAVCARAKYSCKACQNSGLKLMWSFLKNKYIRCSDNM